MKSAPQPIFCIRKHKTEIYEIDFAIRLILFTGFISISTASAQLYGTADTNARNYVFRHL